MIRWQCPSCSFSGRIDPNDGPVTCICGYRDESPGSHQSEVPVRFSGGVGTELKRILSWFHIRPDEKDSCGCNRRAKEMDTFGIEWCKKNKETILEWLRSAAEKRGIPYLRMVALTALNLAIRRAEGQQQQSNPTTTSGLSDLVTVVITHHKRPDSLSLCLDSVKRFYPDLTIDAEDTQGNLSAGRNRLISRVRTPYFFLLEEDMEMTASTSIEKLIRIVESDKTVGGATGAIEGDKRGYWCNNFQELQGQLFQHESERPIQVVGDGIAYRHCDLICNWGVFRTNLAKECPWDEELELAEHREWFWRVHKRFQFAMCYGVSIVHHVDRPTVEYTKLRGRAASFVPAMERKIGLKCHPSPTIHGAVDKPNIVIITVGKANSTITTKQIAALGWNVTGADEAFAENAEIRSINERLLESKESDRVDMNHAKHILENLPQPWVIKDPRFNKTVDRWLPHFAAYKPMLLWVTKGTRAVLDSYRMRGETKDSLARNDMLCERVFGSWPWAKLKLSAEQIADASKLFDRNRTINGRQTFGVLGDKPLKVLAKAKNALDLIDVPFFLSDGTLLGFHRDREFIKTDLDIDLGVWDIHLTPKIVDAMRLAGFTLAESDVHGTPDNGFQYAFWNDFVKVDIFFYYRERKFWHAVWKGNEQTRYVYDPFDLTKAKFMGLDVLVPHPTERVIREQYGDDWETPIPASEWDWWSSPKNLVRM